MIRTSKLIRLQRHCIALLIAILMLDWHTECSHSIEPDPVPDSISSNSSSGSLHLIGGDVYRGRIALDQASDGNLVWKCPSFASNLLIPWSSVERVTMPSSIPGRAQDTQSSEEEQGPEFVFEMQNGETLSGKWTDLTEEEVEIQSPLVGTKRLPRSGLRSILKTVPISASDTGVLAKEKWKQIVPAIKTNGRSKWFETPGSYDTDTAGTAISQMVQIPDLAAIDIDLSWTQASPNWMLTVGEPRRLELHFRKLETRNMISITMLVDDDSSADVATVLIPSEGVTGSSLRILCDSNRGRFVLVKGGSAIAQIKLKKALRLSGRQNLTFTNIGSGRMSLREIKVYTSIFTVPKSLESPGQPVESQSTETLLSTGETYLGTPTAFDPASKTFGFQGSSIDLGRVPIANVSRIEFISTTDSSLASKDESKQEQAASLYQVDLASGARYSGQLITLENTALSVAMSDCNCKVAIPVSEVVAVGGSVAGEKKSAAGEKNAVASEKNVAAGEKGAEVESKERLMKLNSPWATSTGTIERVAQTSNVVGDSERNAIFWKPVLATESVAFSRDLSGTIDPVLAETMTPKKKKPVYGQVRSGQKEPDFGRALSVDEPSLFLKNGDCFPAVLNSLDESHLQFQSQIFESGRIANEFIRGVRVLAYDGADQLEKGTMKRLLTLPRLQRNNPPTHMIVARQGDILRGRLKSMNNDYAVIEVRGSDRTVMMKNVAEVVWLFEAPEIVPPGNEDKVNEPSELQERGLAEETTSQNDSKSVDTRLNDEPQCQALFDTGTRISMVPSSVADNILFGLHPKLGACQIDLTSVARILIGDAILVDANRNRFGKWKLENATDPKFVNDLDAVESQDQPDGGSSLNRQLEKMIGELAPEFELPRLDGELVKLKSLRGKIVVLDFFATWCGPCVVSLPKLNEIAQEYRGVNVELLAVNVEETPSDVKKLLGKLEINPTVVLDSNGAVSQAYHAEALPLTVVIDAEGKVAKIILGGGDVSEKRIRETLDSMINVKY